MGCLVCLCLWAEGNKKKSLCIWREKQMCDAFFAPSLTLGLPTEQKSDEFVPPGQPTRDVFKVRRFFFSFFFFFFLFSVPLSYPSFQRFGLRLLERSDFKHVAEYGCKLQSERCVSLSPQETDLVLSGAHPNVGLFVHRSTGEPLLRLLSPVAKGSILGQFAMQVIPDAYAKFGSEDVGEESMRAYQRQIFSIVQEFQTTHVPVEFGIAKTEGMPCFFSPAFFFVQLFVR